MGKKEYNEKEYVENFYEEESIYRRPNPCDCDENYEEEIENLINFILRELCEVERDVDEIEKAFVRLAKLLVKEACLDDEETEVVCTVAKDLKALDCLVDKTIRDMKCLRKVILK
ncbi:MULTISPECIES: hypothetical protein [Clostridium]|uniref:Uncharacterized protein n=1 Tax=Clostridium cibarium TaxID=2762247 RepID=A0ABR8PZ30_9CLOT|nr:MULTISPECIES: hypothetical protein [Clostridium]MBD7913427.1 hypothetical protein [Clostridium cibarium]